MNVLKRVPLNKVPPRTNPKGGRDTAMVETYNDIVDRVVQLKPDTVLPIECTDHQEVTNVSMALRGRNVYTIRRGTILYASIKETED